MLKTKVVNGITIPIYEFKSNTRNQWRTNNIIWEERYKQGARTGEEKDYQPPVFTYCEYDHHGVYSLPNIYVGLNDPTEYLVATEVFGGWEHWNRFKESKLAGPRVPEWNAKLLAKLQYEGIQAVREIVKDEADKNHFQAAKFLATRGWEPKKTTKYAKKREQDISDNLDRYDISEDEKNIGLHGSTSIN